MQKIKSGKRRTQAPGERGKRTKPTGKRIGKSKPWKADNALNRRVK